MGKQGKPLKGPEQATPAGPGPRDRVNPPYKAIDQVAGLLNRVSDLEDKLQELELRVDGLEA